MLLGRSLKIFTILLLSLVVITSLVEARSFSRYQGRARRLPIAVFEGKVPDAIHYQDLGKVEGSYKETGFFGKTATESMYGALEDMVVKAQSMGANAVVETEYKSKGMMKGFYYQGRAVLMDYVPEK